jgi:hypothetical protein
MALGLSRLLIIIEIRPALVVKVALADLSPPVLVPVKVIVAAAAG